MRGGGTCACAELEIPGRDRRSGVIRSIRREWRWPREGSRALYRAGAMAAAARRRRWAVWTLLLIRLLLHPAARVLANTEGAAAGLLLSLLSPSLSLCPPCVGGAFARRAFEWFHPPCLLASIGPVPNGGLLRRQGFSSCLFLAPSPARGSGSSVWPSEFEFTFTRIRGGIGQLH